MSIARAVSIVLIALLGAFATLVVVFYLVGFNPVALIVAAVLGLVVWGVLRWQQTRRPSSPLLWLLVLGVPLVVIAYFAISTMVTLYTVGELALPVDDHVANYDRLWAAVDGVYPYFDAKPVDWAALREPYRERAAAAASDAEYYAVVADLMGELQDTHSYVGWTSPNIRWTFAELMPVGDQAVVSTVNGTDQIAVGDVVTAVDGRSIDEAIAALPPIVRVSSTPWNARRYALSTLLSVYGEDEALEVTFLDADGESRTVTLTAPDQEMPRSWESPSITITTLPSGVGVIGVTRLWDNDEEAMIATFDEALDSFADAPGLILDLRGNGGGDSVLAGRMAGRFLTAQFDYGREYFRVRLPSRFWMSEGQRTVAPRAPHVDVPLVVLTDELVVSSAEEFVIMLVDSDRAQSVGRTTGGGSGNPIRFTLSGEGATAHFSSGDLRRVNGERLEGIGIGPDVPVEWTLEDIREGRDPDLAAAEALLGVGG